MRASKQLYRFVNRSPRLNFAPLMRFSDDHECLRCHEEVDIPEMKKEHVPDKLFCHSCGHMHTCNLYKKHFNFFELFERSVFLNQFQREKSRNSRPYPS
mmetsp:Transcript_30338/g.34465  ORF Transcript_30338/g.34465 Transcript_30338/m.34465 type:complete len:99 (+) Transcript_30338:250-546(+)